MNALLEIKDLHVAYGKVEAVRGVALTMQPGQIVTVIGPNGAGKTTLLAAAAGLLRSRGSVIYDGIDLRRLDVEERVERGFCLVPERRELFGDMTVADNLLLGAYARRRNGTSVKQRLQEVYGAVSPSGRAPPAKGADALGRRAANAGARPRADGAAAAVACSTSRAWDLRRLSCGKFFASLPRSAMPACRFFWSSRTRARRSRPPITAMCWKPGEITHQGPAAALASDPRVIATYLGGSV